MPAKMGLPKLTVDLKPARLNGTSALAAVNSITVDLLANSDMWSPARDASRRLFADDEQAFLEHSRMQHVACGDNAALFQALEASEWARWHRLLQAAYILGIAIGQRTGGR